MALSWNLRDTTATVETPAGKYSLDLTRPDLGLSIDGGDKLSADAPLRFCGVTFEPSGQIAAPIAAARIDAWTRHGDLVATYEEKPPRNIRTQIYWRLLSPIEFSPTHAADVLAAWELIVSANTSLLDTNPAAAVCCAVHCAAATALRSGLFVFPLLQQPWSYVEMVHPLDYTTSESSFGESSGHISLRHDLFRQRLEKGVILRERVRAAIVNKPPAEKLALAAYDRFAASEPPLTV